MAIYHCSIKVISRGAGRSVIAAAAYRSGTAITDMTSGVTQDYSRKTGVEHTEIILCRNAPAEYRDRTVLWNAVTAKEKQSDAQLAREWEVAIPQELSLEQGQRLVHDFGVSLADEGMCVDIAIHDKGDGNRHAHILATMRPIKADGSWGNKERKAYKLDADGQKIPVIDPKTGEQKIGARGRKMWQRETIEANDWNKKEKVTEWRARWADYCNQYLADAQKIDHRSYADQGIDQMPTIHLGYAAKAMEERGEMSERAELNRKINLRNEKWREIKLYEQIKKLLSRLADLGRSYTRLAGVVRSRRADAEHERGSEYRINENADRDRATEVPERPAPRREQPSASREPTIERTKPVKRHTPVMETQKRIKQTDLEAAEPIVPEPREEPKEEEEDEGYEMDY